MRNILKLLLVIVVLFISSLTIYVLTLEDETMISIVEYYTRKHSEFENNEYILNYDNEFVKENSTFTPKNKNDIINIYYTFLKSGMNEFTFYCDIEYLECINDVKELTQNNLQQGKQNNLAHINGFVHVYNSYTAISTEFKNNGKITLKVDKLYTDEMIEKIDKEVKRLYKKLYNENKSIKDNLKIIHDYIVNNTKYDLDYVDKKTDRLSNTAFAPLFDGYAICSGYTDLMALFLYEMGIDTIRVANEKHTWNLIDLDGEKLIIDLTYDDPVSESGNDHIRHSYFLITSDQLQELDNDHAFNKDIYLK